eukprot:6332344-Prymnesium_polylepis.1
MSSPAPMRHGHGHVCQVRADDPAAGRDASAQIASHVTLASCVWHSSMTAFCSGLPWTAGTAMQRLMCADGA